MSITITGIGLANLLKDFDKKSFASIKAVTIPKLNKKGRSSGLSVSEVTGVDAVNVRKCTEMVIGLGYDYEQLVVNRLVNKEGKTGEEYERGVSWHEPWDGSSVIHQHKTTGERYLFVECIANNKPSSKFVDITTGSEIERDKLVEFLPKESDPENQGLDNPVVVRTFKLDSIRQLKVGGEVYEVERS
jgi:hypothetical protein